MFSPPDGLVEQHNRRIARRDPGKFLIRNQKTRAGIADDVADLVGGEAIVDRQKHRADVACRKRKFEERRAVLHQHCNHVTGADAARGEPAGDAADAMVEGSIGNVLAAIFQRAASRRSPGMKGNGGGKIDHSPFTWPLSAFVSSLHEL
jgi:hypothetical protein